MDATGLVRRHLRRDGDTSLAGSSLQQLGTSLETFRTAAGTPEPRLSAPLWLSDGVPGALIVVRIDDDASPGYLAASVRIDDFLHSSSAPMDADFAFALLDGSGRRVSEGAGATAPAPALRVRGAIPVLGQAWSLEAWPRPAYLSRTRSWLPDLTLLVGLLCVAATALAFVQARRGAATAISREKLSHRLSHTLESITDAFFTLDNDMRFRYVNAQAERLLQRRRQDLVGASVWDEFAEARGTAFEHETLRAAAEGCTVQFEEFYAPLGKWFGVKQYPSAEGLAVYFQDVTELRRAREALRERESELRALADAMPQMAWMADAAGRGFYSNQGWVEYTGAEGESSHGDGWLAFVHPEDRPRAKAGWRSMVAAEQPLSAEIRLRGKDNRYRWFLCRAIPWRDSSGRVSRWIGTSTDIDDLRQAARAIAASEERFRMLARAVDIGIWEYDAVEGTLWWSDTFGTLFANGSKAPPNARCLADLVHPEDRDRVMAEAREILARNSESWSIECRVRRADGTVASTRSRGCILRAQDGSLLRVVGSTMDVTERIKLEQAMQQSQRLEAMGRMTSGIVHDFNNLLTVILGSAEVLAEELQADRARAGVAALVVDAAQRAADVTGRLLAFSRRQPLAAVATDVTNQLAAIEPLLRQAAGDQVAVVLLPPAERPWPVHVDPAQLDAALLNLCTNARDAMPRGGRVELQVANHTVAPEAARDAGMAAGDYVALTVADNGVGIPPEQMTRLFEPFFTTKEAGRGTGLGLPMVYGFIKQSGGHVTITSSPGEGSAVTLYLPRASEAPRSSAAQRSVPEPTSARRSGGPDAEESAHAAVDPYPSPL